MKQQLLDTLEQIAGKENIHPNEPMSRHTTFRVGGPADVLVTPEAEKLAAVTGACREAGEPYYIVGNGKEMALLRLEYPDAPLAELGTYLNPPVGKSGVNHRLRRISEMADSLRQQTV